jgi:hypothetical protein
MTDLLNSKAYDYSPGAGDTVSQVPVRNLSTPGQQTLWDDQLQQMKTVRSMGGNARPGASFIGEDVNTGGREGAMVKSIRMKALGQAEQEAGKSTAQRLAETPAIIQEQIKANKPTDTESRVAGAYNALGARSLEQHIMNTATERAANDPQLGATVRQLMQEAQAGNQTSRAQLEVILRNKFRPMVEAQATDQYFRIMGAAVGRGYEAADPYTIAPVDPNAPK